MTDTTFGEEEYAIPLTAPLFDEKFLDGWILPPDLARAGRNRVYRCLVSGFLFTFLVSAAALLAKTRHLLLRRCDRNIIVTGVDAIPSL